MRDWPAPKCPLALSCAIAVADRLVDNFNGKFLKTKFEMTISRVLRLLEVILTSLLVYKCWLGLSGAGWGSLGMAWAGRKISTRPKTFKLKDFGNFSNVPDRKLSVLSENHH